MSSRPLIKPQPVITDGDMSANITSAVTVCTNLSMISYAYTWVGTSPIGEVVVEVSNDYSQNADGTVRNAGTWNELPLSETATVTGNSDNGFINVDASAGYALRTRYLRTSGTGTMNCIVSCKVA